ncbi:MAG TPA: tetratricopeptide repeat protein [Candidatus Krumholzibacteria bacterium]|nr:tetratricopeptide repeat protein [Candidatus Krumholzibacteria bacterium]
MHSRLLPICLIVLACSSAPVDGSSQSPEINRAKHRAAVQLEAGEYESAVGTLEALALKTPRDDQVLVMLADAYRGLGQFDNAVKNYEQAIRIDYGDHLSHLKLGTWLMENGKTGRALTEFEVAVKFGNDDPLAHYNYGLALYELDRRGEALEQWRRARELDPASAEYAEAVGIGLAGVDDRAAVQAFAEAEGLGRDGGKFYNNYALALERVGRNDEAEKYFIAAATGADAREEYRRNLALHYMRVGDYAHAAEGFAGLCAEYTPRWSYCVYLARARVELGDYAAALAALEPFQAQMDAGKLDRAAPAVDRVPPTLAEALSALGMAWRGQKDLARARDYLARAVALDPREPAHLNNYGVVLAESGMLPEARAQWKRVLEIDPHNATARANLSAYER